MANKKLKKTKQKKATGFHPGKKPFKSRRKTKRIVTKSDREKRTKRRQKRRPFYNNFKSNKRYIQNHYYISHGLSAPVYASMYERSELKRKTFIIHAHGEFFMDIFGNREPYEIPPYINIGHATVCGEGLVIPNHRGPKNSLNYLDDVCLNKFKYSWDMGGNLTDNLVFTNFAGSNGDPVFNAGIWFCDMSYGSGIPEQIYDLEDTQKTYGILATKSKLTLDEVIKMCELSGRVYSGEAFDLIVATCWSPSFPRNTKTNINNISDMFTHLGHNDAHGAASAPAPY